MFLRISRFVANALIGIMCALLVVIVVVGIITAVQHIVSVTSTEATPTTDELVHIEEMRAKIENAEPGSIVVLENGERYIFISIEIPSLVDTKEVRVLGIQSRVRLDYLAIAAKEIIPLPPGHYGEEMGALVEKGFGAVSK